MGFPDAGGDCVVPPGIAAHGVLLVQLQHQPAAHSQGLDVQVLVVAQGVDQPEEDLQRVRVCRDAVAVRRHRAGLGGNFVGRCWLVAVVRRQDACGLEKLTRHSAGIAVRTAEKPSRYKQHVVHTLECLCKNPTEGVGCVAFRAGQEGQRGDPIDLPGGGAGRGCAVVLVGAPRGLRPTRQHLPVRRQRQIRITQTRIRRRGRGRRGPEPL
mmetsp:Transcript_47769/g.126430  ORF Transcript_47769/g.126430 Transcript_47769/m.126430 type:complete len:211 (+) Transcript_47769:887-1519(+)